MPSVPRSPAPIPRRNRAATVSAPLRTQRLTPLAFATPCSQIYCENRDSHTSLLSNLYIAPCLPRERVWQNFSCISQCYGGASTCHPTTSPPALYCEKQSSLASPNKITHTKISKKSYAQRATQPGTDTAPQPRRNRVGTAPHTASHTTSFRNPVQSDLLWKQGFAHFLTFNLACCPTPATQSAICGPPHDSVIQWWVTSWLLHHLTDLFNCGLPLDFSPTWLSYSIVSYLLLILPLDWAIQLWATSWLSYTIVSYLYHFTELFNCELPLDYSTTWLSYSSVSS